MAVRYHIEESGSGAPLLLLHGFTGSCRSWDDIVPSLAIHYRVICVDLPGHGQTPAPEAANTGTLPAVAAVLAMLLAQHNAVPAHILGYSMGARLALGLALLHPNAVRSLILESGSPGLASEAERTTRRTSDEALATRIEQDGITAFVEEWQRLPLWDSQKRLPADIQHRQHTQRLQNTPHGLAASLRQIGTGVQPSFWHELPQLQIPTLLITGELDTKFTQIAKEMCQHNPHFQHQIIAHAGHTPHLEQPSALLSCVATFLRI